MRAAGYALLSRADPKRGGCSGAQLQAGSVQHVDRDGSANRISLSPLRNAPHAIFSAATGGHSSVLVPVGPCLPGR